MIDGLISAPTETVPNRAVAVILPSVAIGLAATPGIDYRRPVEAVMHGAPAGFATPIGH